MDHRLRRAAGPRASTSASARPRAARRKGPAVFICHLPQHEAYGMVGQVVVGGGGPSG
jgi:FtsP/CotA-like multicopper oxidase with cupredoxin domain